MAARLSLGLVNNLMSVDSFADSLGTGVIDIYSGPQPTLPDNAATGTLLVTLTNNSGAYTAETRAVGSITLTGGAAGSVNTVTVNGIDILGGVVNYDGVGLNTTATLVAAQINRNTKNRQYIASTTGTSAVVTIAAAAGLGTLPNTWAVAASLTTLTATYVAMTGGVDAANGLLFDNPTGGVLPKRATQTWGGTAVASGTAGWFRLRESTDTGIAATTTAARYDGAIATAGAEMNLGSLTVTLGAPFSISGATFTLPQQ